MLGGLQCNFRTDSIDVAKGNPNCDRWLYGRNPSTRLEDLNEVLFSESCGPFIIDPVCFVPTEFLF